MQAHQHSPRGDRESPALFSGARDRAARLGRSGKNLSDLGEYVFDGACVFIKNILAKELRFLLVNGRGGKGKMIAAVDQQREFKIVEPSCLPGRRWFDHAAYRLLLRLRRSFCGAGCCASG
jgi:hypothetical protein